VSTQADVPRLVDTLFLKLISGVLRVKGAEPEVERVI
jgi:hypothetical protein